MALELTEEQVKAGWTVQKLGDLFRVKHGFAFKGKHFSEDLNLPTVVTPGNFAIGGGFKSAKPKTYDAQFPEEYKLKPNDYVVTMTDLSKAGGTLGMPAKIPNDGVIYLHNQRIGKIEFKTNRVVKDYIYYKMMTADYHHFLLSTASGSTVRHTSPTKIEQFEIILPPLEEQKRAAEILGSLDDKIEANNTLLNSLDEYLRLDYVASIKQDKDLRTVSNIAAEVREGVSAQEIDESDVYVGLEHLPRRNVWLSSWGNGSEVTSNKSRFKKGDILFGKLRPYFHKVVVAPVDGVCSTDIIVVRPKPGFEQLALQVLSSDAVIEYATNVSNGTRMPRAKWSDLKDFEVRGCAELKSVASFELAAALIAENRQLAETRDLLIHQLIG